MLVGVPVTFGALAEPVSPEELELCNVELSTVYSKLIAVADDGKFDKSVKQQHFTKSKPFSLPPQLFLKKKNQLIYYK